MSTAQQALNTQQSFSEEPQPRNTRKALAAARTVLEDAFGPIASRRFAVRFWEGTVDEPAEEPRFTIVLETPGALRRMLMPPSELSLVESYIFGAVDVEGDLEAAATLGDIAGRLDIRKTALYHYFPDKDAILYACHREGLAEVERILAEARAKYASARDQLRYAIHEHVRVMTDTLQGSALALEVSARWRGDSAPKSSPSAIAMSARCGKSSGPAYSAASSGPSIPS